MVTHWHEPHPDARCVKVGDPDTSPRISEGFSIALDVRVHDSTASVQYVQYVQYMKRGDMRMGHGTSTAGIPATAVVEASLTDNQRILSDHILPIHNVELLKFAATVTLFATNIVGVVGCKSFSFVVRMAWH